MIVTSGVALTGTRDGKVLEFEEGETVWCPANLDHWHGATPDAAMTHLVITGMSVVEARKAEGITDPVGKAASALPDDKNSLEVGKAVQTELAGQPVSGPLFDFAPAINEFLQSHLIGDLFARGILDYRSREIATVSALASLDGVESQLKAHISIASNVGLTATQIREWAAVLSQTVGEKEGRRAEQAVRAALPERDERPASDS